MARNRGYWARNHARATDTTRLHYVMNDGRTLCGRSADALHLRRVHAPLIGTCRVCAHTLTVRVRRGEIATTVRAITRAELAEWFSEQRASLERMRARVVADVAADGGDTLTVVDHGARVPYRAAPMTTVRVPAQRRTVERSHIPDAPSSVSGVSPGVTQRGMHSAVWGARESSCDDALRADAWRFVAEVTFTDRWHAGVLNTLRKLAHGMGRTPDMSERDDVAQDARPLSVDTLATLMARDDVTRTPATHGPACQDCAHGSCVSTRALNVADVALFSVPRERRCGACDGCADADDMGASRWHLAPCFAPIPSLDVVAPTQVIARHVLACARASMRTMTRLGITRTGETTDAPVDLDDALNGPEVFGHLPDCVAELLATVVRATHAIGDDVASPRGGGLSETTGSVLALALGLAPTADGRRRALTLVREMTVRADRARARASA